MCKQKVGRVKSAKLSFSKVLGSDCSQLWVRDGPAKPEGRPIFTPEVHCSMGNPLLYLKPKLTLLI